MISRLLWLVALVVVMIVVVADDEMEKRSPLGSMRFGKRFFASYDDMDYSRLDKRSPEEETQRSIRAPLGTMRFGKRGAPIGTMRFGKRSLEEGSPFGTMRFGKRSSHEAARFRKCYSSPFLTTMNGKKGEY